MYPPRVLVLLFALLGLSFGHCPDGEPCIRKCCPIGERIDRAGCVPGGEPIETEHGVKVVHAKPNCDMYYLTEAEEHTIHHNGTISYYGEVVEYCRDYNELNSTFTYTCFPPEDEEMVQLTQTLEMYSLGLFVSLPFLATTVIVYACLSRLRNLHGRCVLNHAVAMFLAYGCLALVQNNLLYHDLPCTLLGYAIQFFFLGTFFWLNVMCFDIYWAFSGIRKPTGSVKERDRKKLILYSIYAWGIPLLILLVTIAIDFSPGVPDTSIFKPKVGVEKCFFREYYATLIYFYMPMGIIIISNIILFSITAYRISSLRKETAVLKKDGSRKHDHNSNDKERFSLYFKLFLVMGINWVMELISALVGGPNIIWYVPDITNTLQGVFIFIIFVWKRRVRRLIWAKLNAMCGKELPNGGAKGQWSGSTRNTGSVTTTSGYSQNSVKKTPSNAIAMTPQVPDS